MAVGLIRSKLVAPRSPEPMVSRPRLAGRVIELVERAPVTFIWATAGAGKTTAVLEAALSSDRPLAWLTVDSTETAPGRLVTYLEAALASVVPDARGVGTRALSEGAPHVEAAGLLADSVGDVPVLLVIDELDRLAAAPQALEVVGALLRYAPAAMRAICISRVALEIDLGSTERATRVGCLREHDLAFTVDEAAAALRQIGNTAVDAEAAVDATGGWVTGVLFEAWRSEHHTYGAGGDADALHGYLGREILGRLPQPQRDLLIISSVLDDISAEGAAALGVSDANKTLAELHRYVLPGSWSRDGLRFRPHMRFREYLWARLHERPARDVRAVRVAHGSLLADAGRFEEATEEFLRGDAPEAAAQCAERVILGVLERGDVDGADRWLSRLGETAVAGSPTLAAAALMTANALEDCARAVAVADRIVTDHRRSGQPIPGRLYGLISWCYFLTGRDDDDARALAEPGPDVKLEFFARGLEAGAAGVRYTDMPVAFGCDMDDGVLRRIHLGFGRVNLALAPARSPWWRFVNAPWHIEGLLVSGRIDEALAALDEVKRRGVASAYLTGCVEPDLLATAGRPQEALATLAAGREMIVRTGSTIYEIGHLLIQAKLALRLSRDTVTARAALARLRQLPGADRLLRVRVGAALWEGLRLLLDHEDAAAHRSLQDAVRLAREYDRLLEIPTAAVYLAEAAWRCGDEAGADEAADLALSTSQAIGSNHLLLLALRDFPAIAARRIDAERDADTEWHGIGRALIGSAAPRSFGGAPIRVRDLGELHVEIGEEPATVRLRKGVELLAYLVGCPEGRATREDVLTALFDARNDDSTAAYLRQAVARLREALPADVIERDSDRSFVLRPGAVISDASLLQTRLADAAALRGDDRRAALADAVSWAADRTYLTDVDAEWASVRRARLDAFVLQARTDLAQLALDAGDYTQAELHATRVVADDAYRESAWRVLMKVRSLLGDDDGVIAIFRSCADALESGGIAPAESTRDLLVTLRR